MLTSFYCFAPTSPTPAPAAVLDDLQARAGVDGVTLAAAYHAARDVFPHARGRRIRFLRGGEVHFRRDPALWRGSALLPAGGEPDVLGDLVTAATARGMHVDAWTVFLHVDREHDLPAGLAEETCFGDPLPTQLCPANPDVRRYAVTLAREVARRGVRAGDRRVAAPPPLEHGYHHERYFVALPPLARACSGSASAATAATTRRCGHGARRSWRRRFDADDPAGARTARPRAERTSCSAAHLGAYGEARVASLVARGGGGLPGGGRRAGVPRRVGRREGLRDGPARGRAGPEIAWQMGVDVAPVARAARGIGAIAYAADPARVALDLDAYRAVPGRTSRWRRAAPVAAGLHRRGEPGREARDLPRARACARPASTTTAWRRRARSTASGRRWRGA